MIVRSGPFSELENACPSEISNHFPNWKKTAHPGPFFKLKMNVLKSMICQCSLPTWRFISSLSAKGVISTIPNLSRKYANFILDRGFVKISIVYSYVGIYWSFTSPS
jgi:hypothetical protein